MRNSLTFKQSVIEQFIQRKKTLLNQLKTDQQERLASANQDDIDKQDLYESPKEQMMDEVAQRAEPLDALDQEIQRLQTIDLHEAHKKVGFGSLVHTDQAYFLVAAPQDAFTYDGQKFIGLSAQAPLLEKMEGLRPEAKFQFGDNEYAIVDIV